MVADVDLDLHLHSREAQSVLIDKSPVNFEYDSDVPPESRTLIGWNIDIGIDRSGAPVVKHTPQRQYKHAESGLAYDKNKGRGRSSERGRGSRELTSGGRRRG